LRLPHFRSVAFPEEIAVKMAPEKGVSAWGSKIANQATHCFSPALNWCSQIVSKLNRELILSPDPSMAVIFGTSNHEIIA
jgi:hypothetical protein